MTETHTPSPSSPARQPDVGAPASSNTKLARDELRTLFKRYYDLLGFSVKERDGRIDVFEAGSTSPSFSYVFDRKTFAMNQDAKLVTFNSRELENIIETIKSRGKIARAYIPFEFNPKVEFQRAIEQLAAKAGTARGFVNNGTITLVKHNIGYVPFLMFISRIDFSSVDASTEIERVIIPLIDQGKITDEIKKRIEYYVSKLDNFFYSENSRLVNHMPVAGELLEIPEEQIESLVEKATPKLLEGIKARTSQVEGKLQARLQKEIDIIDTYYKQLKLETAAAIEAAREKREKEKVNQLEHDLESIEKEQKFKTAEYQSIYRLDTQFEVLGAAAVYVPIFFQFLCKIKSVYGDIDFTLDYNIFDKEIIPPTCTCGNTIFQGHVCSNLHFSCTTCTSVCNECKVDICSACKPKRCNYCDVLLCSAHAVECECCAGENIENRWSCKQHSGRCDLCGKSTCQDCKAICKECGKTTCADCGIYECKGCRIQLRQADLCKNHAHECARCADAGENRRWACNDHARKCTSCGCELCEDCAFTCSTCLAISCKVCGVSKCRICGSYSCKQHTHHCASCEVKGEKNPDVCEKDTIKCEICKRDFCKAHVYKCSVCGKQTCAECGFFTCWICGLYLCKDHATTCHSCEEETSKNPNLCTTHARKCDQCGQPTCYKHLSEKCSVCGKVSCPECGAFKCKVCGTPLCKEHAHDCVTCKSKNLKNAIVCKTHLARCFSCGKDVCTSCKTLCAKCGRTSCTDCGGIICKHCGKPLCQDHAVPCDKCKAAGKEEDWSCADHVVTCDVCHRHLCLKCESNISRCNVCGKAMCSDCNPHRCKDCDKITCDQHHGECTACKAAGRSAVETCVDHTYTCTACGKIICKEHSIVCKVCQDIFCTDEQCSSMSGEVCLPHSFVSALDGTRNSTKDRRICELCHLAYTDGQLDETKKFKFENVCKSCAGATKEQFYLYMRRTGNILVYPSLLNVPSGSVPVKVVVNDRPFTVEANLVDVSMAENALAQIFIFNLNGNAHTLVHVKATGFEILYTRHGVGAQIKDLLSKGGIASEIVLKQPALVNASPHAPTRKKGENTPPNTSTQSPGTQVKQDRLVTQTTGKQIRTRVQKLFAASIRITLNMLQRVMGLEQGEFNEKVVEAAPDNGLIIEGGRVIVAKSDVDKFIDEWLRSYSNQQRG